MEHKKNGEMDVLAVRYDVGFAQEVCDRLAKADQIDARRREIGELKDLAASYKAAIRDLAAKYRRIKAAPADGSEVRLVYQNHEMILIRRQISDLLTLFRMARADGKELAATHERLSGIQTKSPSPPREKYRAVA